MISPPASSATNTQRRIKRSRSVITSSLESSDQAPTTAVIELAPPVTSCWSRAPLVMYAVASPSDGDDGDDDDDDDDDDDGDDGDA